MIKQSVKELGVEEILTQLRDAANLIDASLVSLTEAQRAQSEAYKNRNDARTILELAKATAVMSLPETAKNDLTRQAYITKECTAEIRGLTDVENRIYDAEAKVQECQRMLQLYQNQFLAAQKRALLVSALCNAAVVVDG
jgi:hypothetical protein